jgi:hypothetical protein
MVNTFDGSSGTQFPFAVNAFDGSTGHCLLTVNAFDGAMGHCSH